MGKVVLVSAPYFIPVVEQYRAQFDALGIELRIADVRERLGEAELLELVGDIDGTLCGDDQYTAKVLDSASRLRVIAKWGTGIDSIDSQECVKRGIAVCNTPDAFTKPVADSVLGYILSFARRLPEQANRMQAGHWEKIPGRALNELILGVIGIGNIGRAVIQRARACGMSVLGNDIQKIDSAFLNEFNVNMCALDELLEQSDFISVNCTFNSTSHHLLSKDEFARMKSTAVVINTARGSVVNEEYLINALESKSIGGAALDVYEFEPLPQNSPLRSFENVMLAAHNSNSSQKAWEAVHESTVKQLLEHLS